MNDITEPTELRWYGVTGIARLPVGSIIKQEHSPHAMTQTEAGAWAWAFSDGNPLFQAEMPDVRYLVLYVPRPPVPEVGAELTQADLEYLPDRAVIIDDNGLVAQVSVFGKDGGSRSYNGPICPGEESEDARGIWMEAKRPIKLLHLVGQK